MNDYYFRVKASDRGEMRRVLRAINVLKLEDGESVPKRDGDAWYEVGRIIDWQSPNPNNPVWVKEPISGEAYWHYNLRTDINVRARVRQLVLDGDPDAVILDSAKGRWFSVVVSDEDASPARPKVVWL